MRETFVNFMNSFQYKKNYCEIAKDKKLELSLIKWVFLRSRINISFVIKYFTQRHYK